MELRHLKYFLAVADTLNFTQAAANCFIAQSALSAQIVRLERELGSALFTRSSRSVRLTPAGELLVPLATRMLADAENVQTQLDALSGLRRGRLRLGLIQTWASGMDLIAVMSDYRARFPGIDFHVTYESSTHMAAAVAAGALDVAVVGLAPRDVPEGLDHYAVDADPLVAVVPHDHPLADRESIALSDLGDEYQVIQFGRGTGLRRQVEAAFASAGVELDQNFEVGQINDMIRLAAHGVGVTVVPRCATTAAQTARALEFDARVLSLSDPAAVHCVTVVYDRKVLSPAATAFLELIRRHVDSGGNDR